MEMKTILVLLSGGDFSMQMFRGILRYARTRGWHLQMVEYMSNHRNGGYCLNRSPAGPDIDELLKLWRPDGCLVECSLAPDLLCTLNFRGIPTVFLDQHPPQGHEDRVCVYSDAKSIVRLAARELLMSGADQFAYVPWITDTPWSRERGEAFSDCMRLNGKRVVTFRYPQRMHGTDQLLDVLSPWVKSLPRPCGVFAANDQIANGVLLACACHAIAVPDEISVVGVDDLTYLCESNRPTISSVQRNFARAGEIAGELLAEALDGKAVSSRTYEAAGFVRRASSRIVRGRDRRVAKACEWIRLHACEGIGPREVVREIGVSRTLADVSFRAALGHTILDEIHAVRLDRVKDLLRREVSPVVIAERCGYSSLSDLRRVFKRETGHTMCEWMRQACV